MSMFLRTKRAGLVALTLMGVVVTDWLGVELRSSFFAAFRKEALGAHAVASQGGGVPLSESSVGTRPWLLDGYGGLATGRAGDGLGAGLGGL